MGIDGDDFVVLFNFGIGGKIFNEQTEEFGFARAASTKY
jgi:hypothetical protein